VRDKTGAQASRLHPLTSKPKEATETVALQSEFINSPSKRSQAGARVYKLPVK